MSARLTQLNSNFSSLLGFGCQPDRTLLSISGCLYLRFFIGLPSMPTDFIRRAEHKALIVSCNSFKLIYMRKTYFLLTITIFIIVNATAQQTPIALTGATIIDVTNYGDHRNDLQNQTVIIQNGKIKKTGNKKIIKIPANAEIIDVTGKYIIPGLIDGFSVLNNQGQANAHLYMGVTTITCPFNGDERRGDFFAGSNPSPHVQLTADIPGFELDSLEYNGKLSPESFARIDHKLDNLDSLKAAGFTTILAHHRFPQELLTKLMQQAKANKISVIGELNSAPYQSALDAGFNSFVHTSRYLIGAMPDSVRIPNMRAPDDSLAGVLYRNYFRSFSINTDTGFINYAKRIASSHTALMPTLSLLYSSLPDHKNLWKEPAATVLNFKDIFLPMDTATGKTSSWMSEKGAMREIEIEKGFAKAGAHYVTGSGADAFGTMPGISEHTEIKMLHDIGLTNRQALAAATNNFSIFWGWNNIGLIETGRNADLLVLSANPLDDLENLKKIEIILLDGKRIDRNKLLKK